MNDDEFDWLFLNPFDWPQTGAASLVFSLGIKASSSSITGFHSPSNLGIERYIEAKEEKKPESLKQPVPVLVQPVQALVTQLFQYLQSSSATQLGQFTGCLWRLRPDASGLPWR